MSKPAQTFTFDIVDLLVHQVQPLQIAPQLRVGILRQRRPFHGAQRLQLLRCFAQPRIEPANAEQGEDSLDPVDDPCLLAHQALPLAAWPPRIFFCHGRDRDHAAVSLLATQPAEKRAHQQFRVDPISLGPPMFAGHRDARSMDDVGLDAARLQPARQPEAVAPGLIGANDPPDRPSGLVRFISPAQQ